jgi:large subunit ribosomal protein L23
MALKDIFKRKPKEPIKEIRVEKKRTKIAKPVKASPRQIKREAKIGEAWKVLKSPSITEKATDLVKQNQYAFKVWKNANKIEIGKAIEDIYGVDVMSVRIINIPSKKRRLGKTSGLKKGYKKAMVKIKGGQKIEVLPR